MESCTTYAYTIAVVGQEELIFIHANPMVANKKN